MKLNNGKKVANVHQNKPLSNTSDEQNVGSYAEIVERTINELPEKYLKGFDGAKESHHDHDALIHILDGQLKSDLPELVNGSGIRKGIASGYLVRDTDALSNVLKKEEAYVLQCDEINYQNIEDVVAAAGIILTKNASEKELKILERMGIPAIQVDQVALGGIPDGQRVGLDGTDGRLCEVETSNIKALVHDKRRTSAMKQLKNAQQNANVTCVVDVASVAQVNQAKASGAQQVNVNLDTLLSQKDVLPLYQSYLLNTEAEPRRQLLKRIQAMLASSLKALYVAAEPLDVTLRIADSLLTSFLPQTESEQHDLAHKSGLPFAVLTQRVGDMSAGNSILGTRGATFLLEQRDLFRGLLEVAWEAKAETQLNGDVRVLIPAVTHAAMIAELNKEADKVCRSCADLYGFDQTIVLGAGIESARSALDAAEISEVAGFFEYNLTTMTETTFAMSEADSDKYVPAGLSTGSLDYDPFKRLDMERVGKIVSVAQHLAGEHANTFPASFRGALASSNEAILLGQKTGVDTFSMSSDDIARFSFSAVDVIQADKMLAGGTHKSGDQRWIDIKQWGLLTEQTPAAVPLKIKGLELPEGKTPLMLAEMCLADLDAGNISEEELLIATPAELIDALGNRVIDPASKADVIKKGLPASPGCGVGKVALSKEKALEYEKAGEPYILVVNEVHSDEVDAVRSATGLISIRGGKTSHAAMVAQNASVPCVMDDGAKIQLADKRVTIGRTVLNEGDTITLDGMLGNIYAESVPLLDASESKAYARLLEIADKHRRLKVYANADTPEEAIRAFESGASGIGLVRTEHMFFEERLHAFRKVLLYGADEGAETLQELEEMQKSDFKDLFMAAGEKKVCVRLLDPPLYEFLPAGADEIRELAQEMNKTPEAVLELINGAMEVDSLNGLRGVRLGYTRPDIEKMQVRALGRAWVEAKNENPNLAPLHITVPMIISGQEFKAAKKRIESHLVALGKEVGVSIQYQIGTMIETTRAALDAEELGQHADYFSYGTNDLTQQTLGAPFGRNVAAQNIKTLMAENVLERDPTASLELKGVARMMKIAEEMGKKGRMLPTGICGGQGSNPRSVSIVEQLGLGYVSVPPGQVPRARFAAAQAAVGFSNISKDEHTGQASELGEMIERVLGQDIDWYSLSGTDALDQLRELRIETRGFLRLQLKKYEQGVLSQKESENFLALSERAEQLEGLVWTVEGYGALQQEFLMLTRQSFGHGLEAEFNQIMTLLGEMKKLSQEGFLAGPRTTRTDRRISLMHINAMRLMEDVRAKMRKGLVSSVSAPLRDLTHRNDRWASDDYIFHRDLRKEESVGAYIKEGADKFFDDHGIRLDVHGLEHIPKDKKVIFACSHRGASIDRFAVLSALDIEPDSLRYLVRKDSPYDRLTADVPPEENPIITTGTFQETMNNIAAGMDVDSAKMIMYPSGTGSVFGESKRVSQSVFHMAERIGAVVVPVTISDTFQNNPYDDGTIHISVRAPIDPNALKKQMGESAYGFGRALLTQYIGSGYSKVIG